MRLLQIVLGGTLVAAVVVLPTVYYRVHYSHTKRLRPVDRGKLYRCGLLTSSGFVDAIRRHGIKTVVNLREEATDPVLSNGRRESELMDWMGVQYIHIPIDLADGRIEPPPRPKAIDRFLEIMDDPDNHPVLLHCQAGVHRTGIFAAIYRMEYQGWLLGDAFRELRANGFQDRAAHRGNEYIRQYLLHYRTRADLARDSPPSPPLISFDP